VSEALNSPVLVSLVSGFFMVVGGLVTAAFARGAQKDTDMRARVAQLEKKVVDLENRVRKHEDYSHELRDHIVDEKGPPPPPWPEGLTR
jgi:hypothetical protein